VAAHEAPRPPRPHLERVAAQAGAQQLDKHHQRPQALHALGLERAAAQRAAALGLAAARRRRRGAPRRPGAAARGVQRGRAGPAAAAAHAAAAAAGLGRQLGAALLQQQRDRLAVQQPRQAAPRPALAAAALVAAAAGRRALGVAAPYVAEGGQVDARPGQRLGRQRVAVRARRGPELRQAREPHDLAGGLAGDGLGGQGGSFI
jgi:hypothetical protein